MTELRWTPDGQRLAVTSAAGVSVRDSEQDQIIENSIRPEFGIFLDRGGTVALQAWEDYLQLIDTVTAEVRFRLVLPGHAREVVLSPTGEHVAVRFLESVKVDLFPDEIYVFTPKGDIKKLPRGATVVDFAYAVHTDVGNTCVAARIDHQMSPLGSR